MSEPWFERTGLISHRVISPKGRVAQAVTAIGFLLFGLGFFYLDGRHSSISYLSAAAAFVWGMAGLFVISQHTQDQSH